MAEEENNVESVEEVAENLKVLENIYVVLTIEVGRTEITIRDQYGYLHFYEHNKHLHLLKMLAFQKILLFMTGFRK